MANLTPSWGDLPTNRDLKIRIPRRSKPAKMKLRIQGGGTHEQKAIHGSRIYIQGRKAAKAHTRVVGR